MHVFNIIYICIYHYFVTLFYIVPSHNKYTVVSSVKLVASRHRKQFCS